MDDYQAFPIAGPRCSTLSQLLGEPLAGTSAVAPTWLCIEQAGPWGRDALRESHIEAAVGQELAERTKGTEVRVALIRRPGSHPDRHRPIPHRVYLAHTSPGNSWLERASVNDPKQLLDLDFAAAAAGTPSGIGELVTEPLLLVCTNGRRDVCCALLGRPIAAALAEVHGERVWECTHVGGHRFSPTAVVLPSGYAYGRLTAAAAVALLQPEVLLEHCRGRSTWAPPGQVADLAIRADLDERDPDALRVDHVQPTGDNRWLVTVSHVDGRAWRLPVVDEIAADLRSASCTAKPTPCHQLVPAGRPISR